MAPLRTVSAAEIAKHTTKVWRGPPPCSGRRLTPAVPDVSRRLADALGSNVAHGTPDFALIAQ